MLGAALFAPARVPQARPRSQDQDQAGVARRPDLVTLLRIPVRDRARAGRLGIAAPRQLDLTVGHDQVRVLVDLVLLELLARGQVDGDDTGSAVIAAEDLRLVRLYVERADVPDVHGR